MIKITGHRGAAGYAPENTRLSFQVAIDLGCDGTEFDVHLSKDGEVVVIHDEEVSRTTNGKGLVREMTLVELKQLNCDQAQKIPTLQEVIDQCKGKINLQIELKAEGTPSPVSKIIAKNKIISNVVVSSFNTEWLKEIKKINSKIKVSLLLNKIPKELAKLVTSIPLDFIGTRENITDKRIITKAHQWGVKIYAYHVNSARLGRKLIRSGIDEIGTDFPKLFIN